MNLDVTDEELTAYLDGEGDDARNREIERLLETDEDLQAQIAELMVDKVAIKDAFNLLEPNTLDLPVETTAPKPSFLSKLAPLQWAAGILLGIAVGWGVTQVTQITESTNWQMAVAEYQVLYTTATLEPIEPTPAELENQLVRVADALNKDFDLDVLSSVDALEYKRAQVLEFEGKPLIQFAFLDGTGVPYALCVIKAFGSSVSKAVFQEMEGMQAGTWSKDGFDYILIGGKDKTLISDAVKQFSSGI